jgi:hypothetical protein
MLARFGDGPDYRRALRAFQMLQIVLQALEPSRGHRNLVHHQKPSTFMPTLRGAALNGAGNPAFQYDPLR